MSDSLTLSLVTRTVARDAPPLFGALAYMDVIDEPEGFHLCGSVADGAEELVYGLLTMPDRGQPETPDEAEPPEAYAAPRYELIDAALLPDVECAHWQATAVPMGDDDVVCEVSMPGWLTDDARDAAESTVAFMRLTARDACEGRTDDTEWRGEES